MSELDRFKRIGGANGRLCKECNRVEVNCECSKLITEDDMKAEVKCELSTEQLIKELKDWSDKLAESGGEAWTLRIPVDANRDPDCLIYEACDRLEYADSKLQALKEDIQNLHNDLSHVDESNWNEAVIDALGRLRKMKNLITNPEDK